MFPADSEADETNNLVVDEPALQIDESWSSEDVDDIKMKREVQSILNEYDTVKSESLSPKPTNEIQDYAKESGFYRSEPLMPVSSDLSRLNDPTRFENRSTADILDTHSLLPAVFDKFTLPSSKTEKIDVTKYLSRDRDNNKTDDDDDDDDYDAMSSGIDDALTDYIVGKDRSRDPRNNFSSMVEKVTKELQNKQQPFEFFSRQIPETSHPTPESLDIKSEPPANTPKHRSIYESSPVHDDHAGTTTTKDKDMRLSSLFMDDTSNGRRFFVCSLAKKTPIQFFFSVCRRR